MKKAVSRRYRVLVTGGPTRAYLDRVRFLSNFSTGELAFELCQALSRSGVEVALVSGPCCQPFEDLDLARWSPVETTSEMHAEVVGLCRRFKPDAIVFAAAVLDFQPQKVGKGKTTSTGNWSLELKPTPKIVDDLAKRYPGIRKVGFKLEWKPPGNLARDRFARKILEEKKLDALCLNYLSEIKGKQHPAYLYSGILPPIKAKQKSEIAAWITQFLVKGWKSR